jgi:hypothetical protein
LGYATEQSLNRLKASRVHYISTSTGTLDFESAVLNDLGAEYNNYLEKAEAFLDKAITEIRLERAEISQDILLQRIYELHTALGSKQVIRTKRVVINYKSNSLMARNRDVVDDLHIVCELSPETDAYTFGFRLAVPTVATHLVGVNIVVRDEEKKSVKLTVLPLGSDMIAGDVAANNVVLFFHEPLLSGKLYRLMIVSRGSEVLYDLITESRQDMIFFSLNVVESVDELIVKAHIPGQLDTDLSNVPASLRPSAPGTWRDGVEIPEDELTEFELAPTDFRAIGWRVAALKKGESAGFIVRNISR